MAGRSSPLAGLLAVAALIPEDRYEVVLTAPSKKLVFTIAEKLKIHPTSLMPFLGITEGENIDSLSGIERKLLQYGKELQEQLIITRARKLRSQHA